MSKTNTSMGNKEKILDTLVKNQTKELEIKAQEIHLKSLQDTNQLDFAKESLKAQIENSKSTLEYMKNIKRMQYIFIGTIVTIISIIIIYSLYTNNSKFAEEIIKALVFLIAGGFGGYGIKSIQNKKTPQIIEE